MFLDPNAYIEVFNSPGMVMLATYEGPALSAPTWVSANNSCLTNISGVSWNNGNTAGNLKADGWYIYTPTGSTEGAYALTSDPTTPNSYQAYVSLANSGNLTWQYGADPCALPGASNAACISSTTFAQWGNCSIGYYDASGQFVSTQISSLQNYANIQNDNLFTDPIYVAVQVPANSGSTGGNVSMPVVIYSYHINQLLDDMTQAQAVELDWEPQMGYDTYCFQTLPTDINQPLARGTYEPNASGTNNFTLTQIALPSGDTATIGNSCGLNFAQWAMTRSLRALSMNMQVSNAYNTVTDQATGKPSANKSQLNLMPNGSRQLLDMVRVGYDQLYMQPFQYLFNMPNGAPYIADPGYSQYPGTQMSYGSK